MPPVSSPGCWESGWPTAQRGKGQTRGGCSPTQEPSCTVFPAWLRVERSRPTAQRLERKQEAAAGQEISPEAVMSAGATMAGGQREHGMGPPSCLHITLHPTPVPPVSNVFWLGEDVSPSPGSHALHLLSSWVGLGQLSPTPILSPVGSPPAPCLISWSVLQRGFCLERSSRFPSPTASSFSLPTPPPSPPRGSALCHAPENPLGLVPTPHFQLSNMTFAL